MQPLSYYRDLQTAKGRAAARAFLVEGERAVAQVMTAHPDAIIELLHDGACQRLPASGLPLRELSVAQLKSICTARTPQGIAAVVAMPADIGSPKVPSRGAQRILYLDDVQDPANVGALIRTAAALGWHGIICSVKCADPFAPKAVQASAGALLSPWIRRGTQATDLLQRLRDSGYRVMATAADGGAIGPAPPNAGLVLILGNEAHGISPAVRDLADATLGIAINAHAVESLNVAVAGAIAMWELGKGCSDH